MAQSDEQGILHVNRSGEFCIVQNLMLSLMRSLDAEVLHYSIAMGVTNVASNIGTFDPTLTWAGFLFPASPADTFLFRPINVQTTTQNCGMRTYIVN